MKRIMCMIMALAMTLALAVPAFALTSGGFITPTESAGQRTLAAVTQVPTIKVFVPAADAATDKLILNPYALKVSSGAVVSGGTEDLTDQVISKAVFLGSLSNVPLKVGLKVVATTGSNVVLASKSLAADTKTTTKSVFLWGQVVDAGTGGDVPAIPTSFATAYDDTAGKTGDMILVRSGTDGVTRTGMYTIPAAADPNDVATATWACAKFFGDAVKAPTEAWTETDTVSLALTFSFTASMNEA